MTSRTPVVFVHGLWMDATSWQGWADRLLDAGYEPTISAFKRYRKSSAVTKSKRYDDRGRYLTPDSGWGLLADDSLNWLAEKGL
jgi:pimeloyl-ACP methyl ester carboxylesterase